MYRIGWLFPLALVGCDAPNEILVRTEVPDNHGEPSLDPNVFDGQLAVSVLHTFEIRVGGDLDPTTIDDTTVRILDAYGQVVPAVIVHNALDSKIVVNPRRALKHGDLYVMRVENVLARSMESYPVLDVAFTTYHNPVQLNTFGSSFAEEIQHDERGREIRKTTRTPGADGKLATADDVIYRLADTTYSTDGLKGFSVTVDGSGPDGAWGSEDDEVRSRAEWTYNEQGDLIRVVSSDAVEVYLTFTIERNERGDTVRRVFREAPGDDGAWHTKDDVIRAYTDYTWDHDLETDMAISFFSGPDGIWFTADDEVTDVTTGGFVDDTTHEAHMFHRPGPDGVWHTDDDELLTIEVQHFDEHRLLLSEERFILSGGVTYKQSDTSWIRDSKGNALTSKEIHNPGDDRTWGTDDDVVSEFSEYAAF